MSNLEKSQQLLARMSRERFFGTVSFQFTRGDITIVRQESTIRPEELPESTISSPKGGSTDHERHQHFDK